MKPSVASKPHILITVGIPGSGKSYFAEHFAATFKASLISFDVIREKIFEKPAFSKDEEVVVDRIANYMLDEIFKSGRTIIFDGRTDFRSERDQIARESRAAGYEPLFIWVQTDIPTAKKRAIKSKIGYMNEEQFNNKVKHFTNPQPNEKFIVVSGKHTSASQIRIILKRLVKPTTPTPVVPTRPPGNRNFLIR